MKIQLFGVSHKSAPIELRERLAIAPGALADATRRLLATPGVREGMILSTCNRVEVLTSSEQDPDVVEFLREYLAVDPETLRPHLYHYGERDAVRHLFRVASSLDSMVVGEPQILGQVKQSYSVARSVGAVQSQLERLLQTAFTVAKRVRTETQIGSASVSVASVAVDLAKKIFGSLDGKRVLLVGAGKMSELAARHLIEQGAGSLLIANRTYERAVTLAQAFSGQAVRFDELHAHADQADIIVTSTGASEPIFRRADAQQFLHRRRNRPIFFIDIALPRDVDPEVNRLEGAFLYDIDDLQSVAASHMDARGREAMEAEAIVAREVERFEKGLQSLDAVPTIVAVQQAFEQVRQAEHRRLQSKLQSLTPEQREAVDALTRGLINKLLHQPLRAIREAAREGDSATVAAVSALLTREATSEPISARDLQQDADPEIQNAEPQPGVVEIAAARRRRR